MPSKEPMISKENRPTAIDYEKPVAEYKLKDLLNVVQTHFTEFSKENFKENQFKEFKEPSNKEWFKESHLKETHVKEPVFKNYYNAEGFKEGKPESKPEGKPDPTELENQWLEKVSARIVKHLEAQGYIKK